MSLITAALSAVLPCQPSLHLPACFLVHPLHVQLWPAAHHAGARLNVHGRHEECLLLDARRAGTLDQAGALAAGALDVRFVLIWTLSQMKCRAGQLQ